MKGVTTRAIFYVHRLIKRHEMTAIDFCNNFKKSIKLVRYLNRNHFVVKPKLIRRGTQVFLNYHTIQRKLCPSMKRKSKKVEIAWTKLVASYRKQQWIAGKFEHHQQRRNNDAAPAKGFCLLLPGDIEKLKVRLEQYKNSYCNTDIAASKSKELNTVEANGCVSPVSLKPTTISKKLQDENPLGSSSKCSPIKNNTITPIEHVNTGKEKVKGSTFLDSLINKLKSNSNVVYNKEKVLKPKQTVAIGETSNQMTDMSAPAATTEDDSSSSSDFLGFNETDTVGLLRTPVVPKQLKNNQSAFISERLDAFLRENALENSAQVEIPKHRRFEEGMVCEGARPPKIQMPQIPNEFTKARTVAEKRILFEKKRSVKYYMIENENTIYRELKKRAKYGVNNIYVIKQMQNLDIPFTRDCWKASTWLHTLNGRFYFRIINIDGVNYKIIGGRGNHHKKYMGMQSSYPVKKYIRIGCPPNCTQHLALKNIKFRQPEISPSNKLKNTESLEIKEEIPKLLLTPTDWIPKDLSAYKPKPLSKKCQNTWMNKVDTGDLQVYNLPTMQLEVFPKVNQPLDDLVKPYLKMILPSKNISREWAEFAVSTLVIKNQSKPLLSLKNSYVFDIPYTNNQKTVLVRKICKRQENCNPAIFTEELKFRKEINPRNHIQVTCADILTEMIDSVAIGLSEDSFCKNDPDIDYVQNVIKEKDRNKAEVEEISKTTKTAKSNQTSRKLLLELKRLNATIVDAKNKYDSATVQCKGESCRLGCICHSIAASFIPKLHCKKVECMFECTCRDNYPFDNDTINKALSTEDALLIRKNATAKLAKVEKEFCATVVLTDNNTYFLNESQSVKTRMKRVPRRFGGFVNNNVKAISLITEIEETEPLTSPCENINMTVSLENLRHCNVILRNLKNLEDIEPWCMIHCLYKCFCKGKATVGESFEIKKQETCMEEDIVYARKRRYSFDKVDDNAAMHTTAKRKYYAAAYNNCSRVNEIPSNIYHTLNRQKLNSVRTRVNSEENEKTMSLLTSRILKSAQYIPGISLSTIQQTMVREGLGFSPSVKQNEVLKSSSLVKQIKSVSNRNRNPKSKQLPSKPLKASKSKSKKRARNIYNKQNRKNSKQQPKGAVHSITLQNFTLDTISSNKETGFPLFNEMLLKPSMKKKSNKNADLHYSTLPATISSGSVKNRKLKTMPLGKEKAQPMLAEPVVDISRFEQEYDTIIAERASSIDSSTISPIRNNLQNNMPVITSVRSLHSTAAGNPSLEIQNSPLIKITNGKISTEDFHTTAIAKLNLAVTKTMQSICNIQKKNSKEIPVPASKTLSSLQWRFFVQAFNEELVFVWEVCVDGKKIITATTTNIMPRVPGAMSASNIKALSPSNLPLLGKMLLDKVMNENMKTLSVLMTGYEDYWHIIGFINSKQDYLTQRCIIKPTPESHPQVSTKVNALYKLLIIREMNNIAAQAAKETKQSLIANASASPFIPTTVSVNKDDERAMQLPKQNGIPNDQMPPSNIELKFMTPFDIDSTITIPIPIKEDHRWLMLSTVDDFSHIYIPAWKNFLTHDRIKKSVLIASRNKKTVRLGKVSSNTDIYATPDSLSRIYFGPFQEETKLDLILYQNVDGKMMLREDFEKSQNIIREKRTVAYWIRINNSELLFDRKRNSSPETSRFESRNSCALPQEDECIIIEDNPKLDIPIKEELTPTKALAWSSASVLKAKPESILKRNCYGYPPLTKLSTTSNVEPQKSSFIKPNLTSDIPSQKLSYSKPNTTLAMPHPPHIQPNLTAGMRLQNSTSTKPSPLSTTSIATPLKVLRRRHSMMTPQSSTKVIQDNPVRQSLPLTSAISASLILPSPIRNTTSTAQKKSQDLVRQSLTTTLDTSSLLPSANPILLNQLQSPSRTPNSLAFKNLPSSLMIIPEKDLARNNQTTPPDKKVKDVSWIRMETSQNSTKCPSSSSNNTLASNVFIRPINTVASPNNIEIQPDTTTTTSAMANTKKAATGQTNIVTSTTNIGNRQGPSTNLSKPTTGHTNTIAMKHNAVNRTSTSANPTMASGQQNIVTSSNNIMNRPSTSTNLATSSINPVASTSDIMNRPGTNSNPTGGDKGVRNDSLLKVRAAPIPQRRLSVPCRMTSQSGYIISNIVALGKVPAEKTSFGYILKFPESTDPVKFSSITLVDKYLTGLVKRALKLTCLEPNFNWRFVTKGAEEQKYQLMSGNVVASDKEKRNPTSTTASSTNRTASSSTVVNNLTIDLKNIKNYKEAKVKLSTRRNSQLPPVPPYIATVKPHTSVSDVILIDD